MTYGTTTKNILLKQRNWSIIEGFKNKQDGKTGIMTQFVRSLQHRPETAIVSLCEVERLSVRFVCVILRHALDTRIAEMRSA